MPSIADVCRHYECVDHAAEGLLHNRRRIKMATVADGVFRGVDEMGLPRLHQPVELWGKYHYAKFQE